jgi:hypothetical protein
MTPAEEAELLKAVITEAMANRDTIMPVQLDSTCATSICSCLQLALRHPANTGQTADIARQFIEGIRYKFMELGMPAHAKLIEAGMDPADDISMEAGR